MSCSKCSKQLSGAVPSFNGLDYCVPCFTCSQCNAPLGTLAKLVNGQPTCVACWKRTKISQRNLSLAAFSAPPARAAPSLPSMRVERDEVVVPSVAPTIDLSSPSIDLSALGGVEMDDDDKSSTTSYEFSHSDDDDEDDTSSELDTDVVIVAPDGRVSTHLGSAAAAPPKSKPPPVPTSNNKCDQCHMNAAVFRATLVGDVEARLCGDCKALGEAAARLARPAMVRKQSTVQDIVQSARATGADPLDMLLSSVKQTGGAPPPAANKQKRLSNDERFSNVFMEMKIAHDSDDSGDEAPARAAPAPARAAAAPPAQSVRVAPTQPPPTQPPFPKAKSHIVSRARNDHAARGGGSGAGGQFMNSIKSPVSPRAAASMSPPGPLSPRSPPVSPPPVRAVSPRAPTAAAPAAGPLRFDPLSRSGRRRHKKGPLGAVAAAEANPRFSQVFLSLDLESPQLRSGRTVETARSRSRSRGRRHRDKPTAVDSATSAQRLKAAAARMKYSTSNADDAAAVVAAAAAAVPAAAAAAPVLSDDERLRFTTALPKTAVASSQQHRHRHRKRNERKDDRVVVTAAEKKEKKQSIFIDETESISPSAPPDWVHNNAATATAASESDSEEQVVVTTRVVGAPPPVAVIATGGAPLTAILVDKSANLDVSDSDDDDDNDDDEAPVADNKPARARPQLSRTERSKAIARPGIDPQRSASDVTPVSGVIEWDIAPPSPVPAPHQTSPVPPRKVSAAPAGSPPTSPRRSQVLLTAAEAAGPKPAIDERGLVPIEALPNMTQEEMLQWTAERLVSKANPLDLYNIDETRRLGKGGFGAVYYGTDKKTGAPVAVKKMQINKRNKMKYLLIETELHAKSSAHPNIVAFIESFHLVEKEEFWVVLEFIDGVTLEALLDLPPFREPQMAHVTREVCRALVYIHAKQRLHRDIKLGNVLIGPAGVVKLTDFGLAAQLTTQRDQRHTLVGTPDLLAPEVIAGVKYGTEVDVWALGMLVLKMCRASPLLNMEPRAVLDKLQRFGAPRLDKRKYSAVMKNFIESAVQMKPSDRLTAPQLLQHEWLAKASSDNFDKMLQMLRNNGDTGGGCVIQ